MITLTGAPSEAAAREYERRVRVMPDGASGLPCVVVDAMNDSVETDDDMTAAHLAALEWWIRGAHTEASA